MRVARSMAARKDRLQRCAVGAGRPTIRGQGYPRQAVRGHLVSCTASQAREASPMNELTEVSMDEPRELGEIRYLVLPDSVSPCLLARMRARLTSHRPSAPYGPSGCTTRDCSTCPTTRPAQQSPSPVPRQSPTTGGSTSTADTAEPVPSLIRRLPANWSSLVPAERHAWSLAPARRRARASSPGRVRPLSGSSRSRLSRVGRRLAAYHPPPVSPWPRTAPSSRRYRRPSVAVTRGRTSLDGRSSDADKRR